ncbi:DUF433 domain-containing protein [candidate division WOR-3 bacterium]|uniref:DUF433 domain-containing protein n=1 Tax=candidate division WOR-3 bacterium TaxID=2052148 RepID=A0A660SG62_UNCW3|nr:MAG: DUF433 domain-containing protein [candidate division WOR-3 bacterium]
MRKNRIVLDPKIRSGKPIIPGIRISVEFLLDLLANGYMRKSSAFYEDIRAALEYAAEILKSEKVYPVITKD